MHLTFLVLAMVSAGCFLLFWGVHIILINFLSLEGKQKSAIVIIVVTMLLREKDRTLFEHPY